MSGDRQPMFNRFLDDLRESGKINMFGAPAVLREMWPELTKKQSFEIFKKWTETFNDE